MTVLTLLGIAILALVIGVLVFWSFPIARAYFTYRGKRLITCPETHKIEAVDVAARKAALTAPFGDPTLRLDRCSRWPERQDCGQECLQQVETDPENCLVWKIVSDWYEGQECVYCHKHLGRLHRFGHAPALQAPDHLTKEWREFRPEQLPELFATYKPVCWDCHVTATFRRVHPELVVDRERDARRMM